MDSYGQAFETGYGVSFFDTRINFVIDNMIYSDLLSSDNWSAYACYFRATRVVLMYEIVCPLFKEHSVESPAARNLFVTHVNDATVYSAVKEDVNLMLRAADYYVKNPSKPSPFLFTCTRIEPFSSCDWLTPRMQGVNLYCLTSFSGG